MPPGARDKGRSKSLFSNTHPLPHTVPCEVEAGTLPAGSLLGFAKGM